MLGERERRNESGTSDIQKIGYALAFTGLAVRTPSLVALGLVIAVPATAYDLEYRRQRRQRRRGQE
ncbi:MAG TPA: hypothetical protein VLG67_00155 [Candidatus Saccharimonadales bacterium]|nr:hypothetical protein [Candidatus Saccharimonadales bacterium]